MRRISRVLIVLLFPLIAAAQPQVWQVPAVAHDVDLREDTSYVVASIAIDVPDTGKVIVRFDGWATSTPGDRIIIGAASYPEWNTNDGNMGLYVFDSLYTVNSFSHSRVYDVEPGSQSFYAVAQNYVDRDGSGIASIDGKLTVEYLPNTQADLAVAHRGILHETYWDQSVLQVVDSVTIDVPADGEVIVQYDGTASLYYGGIGNQYTISDTPTWPSGNDHISVITSDDRGDFNYVQRKAYPVSAGTHVFYALGRRVIGEPTESDDYTYASLTARFVASGSAEVILTRAPLQGTVVSPGASGLGEVTITTPTVGTISVQATGRCTSSAGDLISAYLIPVDQPDSILDARIMQPLLPEDRDTYFSLSGLMHLPAGTHSFRLMGVHEDNSVTFDDAVLSGLVTAQFVADPVVSATEEVFSEEALEVFPNPTSNLVTINIPDAEGDGEVRVFDLRGQLVRSYSEVKLVGFQADLRELGEGVYVLHAYTGDKSYVGRVVKQ